MIQLQNFQHIFLNICSDNSRAIWRNGCKLLLNIKEVTYRKIWHSNAHTNWDVSWYLISMSSKFLKNTPSFVLRSNKLFHVWTDRTSVWSVISYCSSLNISKTWTCRDDQLVIAEVNVTNSLSFSAHLERCKNYYHTNVLRGTWSFGCSLSYSLLLVCNVPSLTA